MGRNAKTGDAPSSADSVYLQQGDKLYKALFSRKTIDKIPEYDDCVHDLLNTSAVQELGEYTHHKGTTRLQHSLNVSYYNFLLCRKLHFDACSAARAGLLHDLFLYDRKQHEPVEGEGNHAVGHPKVAFFNGDMIANHMWPLSPHMPHFRETWVIQFVDKACALGEISCLAARISRSKIRLAAAFSLTLLVRMTIRL